MTKKKAELRKALHQDVWHAAIRYFVYRTPKRGKQATILLQRALSRYLRAEREGRI